MSALKPEDAVLLVKILGLLSSNEDGEQMNAARLATRMLKKLNLTWGDILLPQIAAPEHHAYRQSRPQAHTKWGSGGAGSGDDGDGDAGSGLGGSGDGGTDGTWRSVARELLARKPALPLTPWERDFLSTIARWNGRLSARQQTCLEQVRTKYPA